MSTQHLNTQQTKTTDTVCKALDDSIENLDAQTLSQLNQAKHRALESRPRLFPFQWSMAAAASLALAVTLVISAEFFTTSPTDNSQFALPADTDWQVIDEDVEMISDLDMMMWLLQSEQQG